MTEFRVPRRRFRGSVVSSELLLGVFFDVLDVDAEQLGLRPFGRRDLILHRDEITMVEFERQWVPPIWIRTVVRFRFTDGTYAPNVMVPGRTRAVRTALREAGWPVSQVQFGSTEPREVRPLREHRGRS